MSEMDKLEKGLKAKGLSYERRPLFGGEQIICGQWDAVCHCFSYGYEKGLLEVMGLPSLCGDCDVRGWLAAEEILAAL